MRSKQFPNHDMRMRYERVPNQSELHSNTSHIIPENVTGKRNL